MHKIFPGESHIITLALPEDYRGKEFRVLLDCYANETDQAPIRAKSPSQKVPVRQ